MAQLQRYIAALRLRAPVISESLACAFQRCPACAAVVSRASTARSAQLFEGVEGTPLDPRGCRRTRKFGQMDHRHASLLVLALLIPLASALRPTQQYVGARPTQQHMRRETALVDGRWRLEPRVPTDSDDMVAAAARSVRTALEAGVARQTVELHIPLPPETSPEDLDPWPGGLPQIAEYALPLARECLRKAVKGGTTVQEVVLSKDDGCVQLYCQGETPADDAMMILQPGAETFDELRQLDGAVGERPPVLVNPKLVGPQSLGLFQGAVSKDFFKRWFLRDKFPVTYYAGVAPGVRAGRKMCGGSCIPMTSPSAQVRPGVWPTTSTTPSSRARNMISEGLFCRCTTIR